MDLTVLNNLPEPLKSILIGATGDFLGGMAAEISGRLLDAAGYQVKKRFRPEPSNWRSTGPWPRRCSPPCTA